MEGMLPRLRCIATHPGVLLFAKNCIDANGLPPQQAVSYVFKNSRRLCINTMPCMQFMCEMWRVTSQSNTSESSVDCPSHPKTFQFHPGLTALPVYWCSLHYDLTFHWCLHFKALQVEPAEEHHQCGPHAHQARELYMWSRLFVWRLGSCPMNEGHSSLAISVMYN